MRKLVDFSWRRAIIVAMFGAAIVAGSQSTLLPKRVAAQGNNRLVLAFYYAWFDPGSFGQGKTPFQPVQPYNSNDVAIIRDHVSQAKSAGIDAFVQSWLGPSPNRTETNFQNLLNVAAGQGFAAAVDFETGSPLFSSNEDRIAALESLLVTHATHPAYLRADGKPVIFFWANWLLTVDEWASIRDRVDPAREYIWIAEGANTAYLRVFDGLHLYNIAWSASPDSVATTWASNTRQASQTSGSYKYWVATAMPGFDDRHLGRGQASVFRDRENGQYYVESFNGAAASAPDMLIITSFNEWPEGSNIEPSLEFGRRYLDLTSQLSSAFKSGTTAHPPVGSPAAGDSSSAGAVATGEATPSPAPTVSPTPVASPTARADGRVVYVVAPGDTLIGIAVTYGVTLEALYELNNLTENSILTIGQEIVLDVVSENTSSVPASPFPDGARLREDGVLVYQVSEGDTLISIATKFELSLTALLQMNDLSKDDLLRIGQEITVGRRPQPETVGGSTDRPTFEATPTATLAASAAATAQPTSTSTPTAVALAASSAVPTPTSPPVAPVSSQAGADWLTFLAAAVAILAFLGGMFLYLGRRE